MKPQNEEVYRVRVRVPNPPYVRNYYVTSQESFTNLVLRHGENVTWAGHYKLHETMQEDPRRA